MGLIVNVVAIVLGGFIGLTFGRFIKEKMQETVMIALGIGVIYIGASSTFTALADSDSVMMIISLALGAVIGELIDIDGYLIRFGQWLRKVSKNEKDAQFITGFVEASMTVSVGAMAILGPMNEVLYGDSSVLISKAMIDFVFIILLTIGYGKGCMFSAIPVGIVQGSVALLSFGLKYVLNPQSFTNISLVGGILISMIGINMAFQKKIRVANLLPSLVIAVIFTLF